MPAIFLLLFCLAFAGPALAQAPYEKGQLLVQLQPGYTQTPREWAAYGLRPLRLVLPEFRIYLLETPQGSEAKTLAWLQQQKEVQTAQFNHILHKRLVPNDPSYSQQWQYHNTGQGGGTVGADIEAQAAWNLSTGGLTPLGDTIVVCVIDDGFDLSHPDLQANRWYNRAEIPQNGIDDDQNGYIDDFAGWNAYTQDDDLSDQGQGGHHGTPVAGIIGATGNNGQGVTGVNWQVKMMIVVGGGNEADALEAYAYPLRMRRLYNQSNGQQGAFVVASNASWGLDNQFAADAPLWCALYDSLGQAGILNVAATTNNNTNVELNGDLPTTCTSPYLVAVTNSNRNDQKETSAGYGTTSIDLAAPGTGVYTVAQGATYGSFGGTSAATPHVAGAIGLLYAASCPRLALLARMDPQAAALEARQALLDGVRPLPQLQNYVQTGGRLSLYGALQELLAQNCNLQGCYVPFALRAQPQDSQALVSWASVPDAQGYAFRWQLLGDTAWTTGQVSDTFLQLQGLRPCSDYWIQVRSDCDTSLSAYTDLLVFRTQNCCLAPQNVVVLRSDSTAILQGEVASNVLQVQWEWRAQGDTTWTQLVARDSAYLQGLQACTWYEWRAISQCSVNVNNYFTRPEAWRSTGCGYCLDASFCQGKGNDASFEWIERVQIAHEGGLYDERTGSNGGYALFADSSLSFRAGQPYPFEFSLGSTSGSSVVWSLWLDFNRDGSFDDATERIYLSSSTQSVQDTLFFEPWRTSNGSTRMRVAAKYGVLSPSGCEVFNYGEVEDYCVEISDATATRVVGQLGNLEVWPNPGQAVLQVRGADLGARFALFDVWGRCVFEGQIASQDAMRFDLPKDLPSGVYVWICGTERGKWIRN